MHIVAQLLGIKVRHNFIKDFGGAILDRPNDTEQYAARHTAPRAILQPRLAFEGCLGFDLTLAQGESGEGSPLYFAPPARPGRGQAPPDGLIFMDQRDWPTASLVREGGKRKRP